MKKKEGFHFDATTQLLLHSENTIFLMYTVLHFSYTFFNLINYKQKWKSKTAKPHTWIIQVNKKIHFFIWKKRIFCRREKVFLSMKWNNSWEFNAEFYGFPLLQAMCKIKLFFLIANVLLHYIICVYMWNLSIKLLVLLLIRYLFSIFQYAYTCVFV